jgi:protein SCO1/2
LFSPGLLAFLIATAGPPRSPLADIGPAPATVLVDTAGKRFDLASLRGKVVLVSFVYTNCNGVCPATTQTLTRIQRRLKEANLWGAAVAFVSITLDPKRDTTAALRQYARLFGADPSNWHFLTGSPGDVGSVIAAWGIWVKSDPSGVLDHSSRIFLLDPRGRQREIYNLEFLQAESVLQDVRRLLGEIPEKSFPPPTNSSGNCQPPAGPQQKGLRARPIVSASG